MNNKAGYIFRLYYVNMTRKEIIENSRIIRLHPDYAFSSFDCSDEDLNNFLKEDAKPHLETLFAVTYIMEHKEDGIVAYYSVMNDRICREDIPERNIFNRLCRKLPNAKRAYKSYPAVKIARLGVNRPYQRYGIGSTLLDYIKINFITNNKTGCKFIIVDAYNRPEVIHFYERNGFKILTSMESTNNTIPLYFDLYTIKKDPG